MNCLLEKIAEGLRHGYVRDPEVSRVDWIWWENTRSKSKTIIAIEHENYKDVFERRAEMDKLLVTDADLRVLITYVAKRRFKDDSERSRYARRMKERIEERLPASRNPEFLLLLASQTWEDDPERELWYGYLWSRAHEWQEKCLRISPPREVRANV